MRSLSQLSIRIKLILIVLVISLPVLGLFALYSIISNTNSYRDRLINEIESVAKMTTEYARPFLIFNDEKSTEQLLQFNKLESIEYACIYNDSGEIVSEYFKSKDVEKQKNIKSLIIKFKQENSSIYIQEHLHSYTNAEWDEEVIGTLYIIANTEKLSALNHQSIWNTIIAICIAIGITLLLVFVLQGFISTPILSLAAFTEKITKQSDYSERIENFYQNEIGTLYNSFNAMLDKIESTTVSRGYLNDILSSMAEMLIVLDNDFKIQKVNNAVEDQMGYKIHELLGKKLDILLRRKTNEAFYQDEIIESNFYTKDGERKIVSISLSVLHKESGVFSFIICTARDITEKELAKEKLRENIHELEKTQEQLKIAKELAEASAKAKSEFLSKMSHEIRTPMNAIMGMAHLLLQNSSELEQREDLEGLLTSSESLLTLINDILDFSQIEAGQIIWQKRAFELEKLVQKIVRSHHNDQVELSLTVNERIPNSVIGDEKRLTQILSNLIHNAVKFTSSGGVFVELKLDSVNKTTTFIEFVVRDTGIGIPEDKLELIFESFSQVDNSLTRAYQGKGLGLSIVKRLLEMQGSKIKVQSIINKGSIFSFILGFDKVEEIDGHTNKTLETTRNVAAIDKRLAGMKILLVEDNQMNIIVTKKLLTLWKIEVDVAMNGQIGVERATVADYDIILMDLQMPVMNGLESAKQIRMLERHKKTPIIALTAEVREESQEEALAAGMNDYVAKPFQPNVLFQAIAQFVIPNQQNRS
jgi:PAS domain S-box-containing protein